MLDDHRRNIVLRFHVGSSALDIEPSFWKLSMLIKCQLYVVLMHFLSLWMLSYMLQSILGITLTFFLLIGKRMYANSSLYVLLII
jgi:hypothetical protein